LNRGLHYLQMDRNKLPFDPHLLGDTTGATKKISMPVGTFGANVHLSCTEINTVSNRTETSFHVTHVT
jgi:hypothetical protein